MPNRAQQRDVQWADGLRGVAGVCVVISHLHLAFAPNYLAPSNTTDGPAYLFQMPFFRILGAGNPAVAIFFLLSGYVCSMKPLKLSRAGKFDEARACISSSAFRRILRLAIPATCATILAWAAAQFNLFAMASTISMPYGWLQGAAPLHIPGFWAPIRSLFHNCLTTWMYASNGYDGNQWTMGYEVRGSMFVYMTLIGTTECTVLWRRTVFFLFAAYFWLAGNILVYFDGFLFFVGALLADISLSMGNITASTSPSTNPRHLGIRGIFKMAWPIALALLAIFIGSQPSQQIQRKAWSRFLDGCGALIFPAGNLQVGGFSAVYAILLTISILFSPTLRRLLSHPRLVFLGSISFPMYLLHATLIKTLLVWIFYGVFPQPYAEEVTERFNDAGRLVEQVTVVEHPVSFIWTIIGGGVYILWFALLMFLSVVWKNHIDAASVKISLFMEELVSGKRTLSLRVETGTKDVALENVKEAGVIENGYGQVVEKV